jgi:hypothetical protein
MPSPFSWRYFRLCAVRTSNSTSWKGGHPFNAGHPAPSITCREGLMTLPGPGQLVNL